MQSHSAVLQQRFKVLIAARQRSVDVGSSQAAAPLALLARLCSRRLVLWNEERYEERHQDRARTQQERRAWDYHTLVNRTDKGGVYK